MFHYILLLLLTQIVISASCEEMGYVFIRGKTAEHHVLREVTRSGEVWLPFGRRGQQWNHRDSVTNESPILLLPQTQINAISDFDILAYVIESDVEFYLQSDDSTNPSFLKVSKVTDPSHPFEIKMGYGRDHTNLRFAPNVFDRIRCTGTASNNSNMCGHLNKPDLNQNTEPIIIWEVLFRPTDLCLGASASSQQWQRNKFTWVGTKYVVKIKIEDAY